MSLRKTIRWRAVGLAFLLPSVLAISGSSAALPSDASDLDAPPPHRSDTPATPSLRDQPASPAPAVVSPASARPAEPKHAPSANPLWAIPLGTLTNTRERPIFSHSRRPPPPAVAPLPVAKASPPPTQPTRVARPQLTLVGTIAGPEQSFGIFIDQTTRAALRLKIGDEYQGWRLRDVQAGGVTLEHDQQTAILSLPQPDANAPQPARMQAENTSALPDLPARRGGRR